ncbi:hypothetical protein ABZV14_26840 [Streptosporangium canum]|uniref:hypothetical protein n=1 Tax=Streptosporangium canum TaxID=324952 RepID=UPI0033B92F21
MRAQTDGVGGRAEAVAERPRSSALAGGALSAGVAEDGERRYIVQQVADEFGVTRPTIYRHLGQ